MRIRVSIVRTFDEEHLEDFDVESSISYALSSFADDIDQLVKYNEVRDHALVEVLS